MHKDLQRKKKERAGQIFLDSQVHFTVASLISMLSNAYKLVDKSKAHTSKHFNYNYKYLHNNQKYDAIYNTKVVLITWNFIFHIYIYYTLT